nr:MAG TPA: hypothetical protein [Caudoviricetes sp.]
MNCFLKDLTKNLYETKNIVHQPQAIACGFLFAQKGQKRGKSVVNLCKMM